MNDGDSDLAADRALARRLSRTWDPFFGRFGRLTEVQRAAIPPILDGTSTLVCAPTATGKTEAACAPLVETRIRRTEAWTILYISPTRALVNDLYERLDRPLERLRLRVVRRTGDHRDALTTIPHVLITTPESFDSLLCRGRRDDGHVLAHVDAVVLDEIHLLHASARGEQVRWLLERLRRLRRQAREEGWSRSECVQVVALSATVPSPDAVRNAYLSEGQLIQLGGGREIEAVAPDCDSPSVECALPAYIRGLSGPEKVLVFSNARLRVDALAMHMRQPLERLGYVVRAHHGSLSQGQREATETAAKSQSRIVVFATSTLEIGIDIGDIDLVVLDGPAPDVPALLQRIGRGNRRTQRTRVMACSGSMAEVLIQTAMLSAARESSLGPLEQGPHYAVVRQQLASYIFQAPHIARSRETLMNLLACCVPELSAPTLLDHLAYIGDLEAHSDGLRLGASWGEASARGEIHSNIEGQLGSTVIDQSTGEPIAHGVEYKGGNRLAIGGNLLDVKTWRDQRIEVRKVTKGQAPLATWSYTSSSWVQGAGQPQTVRRHLGFIEDEWPVLLEGRGCTVFHFGGARLKALLRLLASRAPSATGIRIDNWTLQLPSSKGIKPRWLLDVGPAIVDLLIEDQLEKLEAALGRPRTNRLLPLDIRAAEVRAWLNVEEQLAAVRTSRWVIPDDGDLVEDLLLLQRNV